MQEAAHWWVSFRDWADLHAGVFQFLGFAVVILGGIGTLIYKEKWWDKLEDWLKDPANYPDLLNDYRSSTEDSYFRAIRRVSYWANRTYGRKPFSRRAFGTCLTIASVYPILAAFLAWLVANSATPGGLVLFKDNPVWWDRLWRGAVMIAGIVPLYLLYRDDAMVMRWLGDCPGGDHRRPCRSGLPCPAFGHDDRGP